MNKEQRERLRAGLTEAQLCRCRTYLLTTKDAIALLDALDAAEAKAWPIAIDGPTPISDQRMWLARQLMDSKLTDAEAFGVVAYHPDIKSTRATAAEARATAAEARVALLEGALRELTTACETDFEGAADMSDEPDDEAVGGGLDGDMAITFGMLRRARAALAAKLGGRADG